MVALAIVSCLVPVAVITSYAIINVNEKMLSTIGENLRQEAKMVGGIIDDYFTQREIDAKVVSQANALESDDTEEQKSYFNDILDANKYIKNIMVVDFDKNVFSEAGDSKYQGMPIANAFPKLEALIEKAFKGKQGEVYFGKTHLFDEQLSINMVTPITDDSNINVISCLVLRLNLEPITKVVSDLNKQQIQLIA